MEIGSLLSVEFRRFIPDPLVRCPLGALYNRTRPVQGVLIQSSFRSHAVENDNLEVQEI